MKVSFLRMIDNEPVSLTVTFNGDPIRKFVQTNRGEMLKIKIKESMQILHDLFEVSYTSEYMYIPMKYVKELL